MIRMIWWLLLTQQPELEDLYFDEIVVEKNETLELPPFRSIHIEKLKAKEGSKIRLAAQASGGDGENSANGTHGSSAPFFLGKIEGHILIESVGGNGGQGKNGRNGKQGADGKKGRNGRTLLFGAIYVGKGDDGQNGLPGENGEDGGDGGNGGDGGRILLFYKEKTPDAKILVNVSGGQAGQAGLPGLGGLGGNGGPGGKGTKSGNQGRMGVSGNAGKPGKPGRPGNPGEALIYQVSSELFECLSELHLMALAGPLSEEDFDQCRALTSTVNFESVIVPSSQSAREIKNLDEKIILIEADGESGKSAPSAYVPGSRPFDASSGSNGGNVTVLISDLPNAVVINARGGDGGQGGNGANGKKGADGKDGKNGTFSHKAQPGEDGEDGGDGGAGSNGGSAGNGGHIRVVRISAKKSSDWTEKFEWNVDKGRAGKGGFGGIGGKGGQGGKGGKGRYDDETGKRILAASGKNGQLGKSGAQGYDGEDSMDGTIEFLEAKSYATWVVDDFKRYLSLDQ